MSFEERIDRLKERHEALVQIVELTARNNMELKASLVEMRIRAEQSRRQFDGLLLRIARRQLD